MRNNFFGLAGAGCRAWVGLPLVALLVGCTCNAHHFETGTWVYHDSVRFEQTVVDTHQLYRLRLTLKVNDEYRYRNLYVRFRAESPGGAAQTSLAQLVLSDSLGNWLSERSWQGTYHFETVLNDSARFAQAGTYQFYLRQYMREDTLQGVEAVEFIAEPVD